MTTGQLSHRVAWSVVWVLAGTGVARVVALAGMIVLARLLTPADFGLVALVFAYVAYVETVADLGVSTALVFWPSRRDDAAQVVLVVGVLLAVVWFGLTWWLSPVIADWFDQPAFAPLSRVLAGGFVVRALAGPHDAISQRNLQFKARLWPELGSAVSRTVASVIFVLSGLGVWGLIAGHLVGTTVSTIALWLVVPWRPQARWPRGLLAPMLRYGRHIALVNVIGGVVHHVDTVVVGRLFGLAALGFYQMAFKVPDLSITLLVRMASKVVFPTLARLSVDDSARPAAFVTTIWFTALAVLPAAVLLAALADPIVAVCFGAAWAPSAAILQVLAWAAAIRALGSPAGDLLKASGRPGLLAALSGLRAVLMIPVLLAGAAYGVIGVAYGMAVMAVVGVAINLAAVRVVGRVPLHQSIGALAPGAAVATLVMLFMWSVDHFWLTHLSATAALVIGSLVGAAGALAALRLIAPSAWRLAASSLSIGSLRREDAPLVVGTP